MGILNYNGFELNKLFCFLSFSFLFLNFGSFSMFFLFCFLFFLPAETQCMWVLAFLQMGNCVCFRLGI